jgi:hypothetical protein
VHAWMVAGPAAPSPGESKNSWLTRAADWRFVAVTQWILGIRPEDAAGTCVPLVTLHAGRLLLHGLHQRPRSCHRSAAGTVTGSSSNAEVQMRPGWPPPGSLRLPPT